MSLPPKQVSDKYQQDGQEAREIAKYLPFFPFKGIPRFYDIGAVRARWIGGQWGLGVSPLRMLNLVHNILSASSYLPASPSFLRSCVFCGEVSL